MQGIKITANKCPEPHAGASKKQVRRTMLIGSCTPCDSAPRGVADWIGTNRLGGCLFYI